MRMTKLRAVALIGSLVLAVLSACDQPSSVTSHSPYNMGQNSTATDYNSLSCDNLQFLARKYSSIADSVSKASGDSPAAQMSAMQGAQAANFASRIYGIMAQKGCSVTK